MTRRGRLVAVVGSALAITAAFGGAAARGVATKSEATRAVSPCGTATAPAWSPEGTQIAWYGFRWPLAPNHHAVGSYNIVRAICVSDADGKHLHRLPNTVCSERCPSAFSDPPGRLDWVGPSLLLAGNDLGVFAIPVGQKPKLLGKTGPVPFSVDAAGDRVATGPLADCAGCFGPVTIRGVPSGAVVGVVGGTKLDSSDPSLSPDGKQVVFARGPAGYSGRTPGLWIAAVDGSHLRRLELRGDNPLWSPAGNRIAYLAPAGAVRTGLRLVAPQGGASTTLVRNATGTVFGWSPNGRLIAYPDSKGRLAVVDVATKKVRRLLKLHLPYDSSSVVWSPDSRQLLVVWRPPTHSTCRSGLWRVPIDGAEPRLVHGC